MNLLNRETKHCCVRVMNIIKMGWGVGYKMILWGFPGQRAGGVKQLNTKFSAPFPSDNLLIFMVLSTHSVLQECGSGQSSEERELCFCFHSLFHINIKRGGHYRLKG